MLVIIGSYGSQISAAGLPPEAQRDVLIIKLAEHLKTEQWQQAYPFFAKIDAITKANKLKADDSVVYYHGEVAFHLQKYAESEQYLTNYINKLGDKGSYYAKSLKLLSEIPSEEEVNIRKMEAGYIWLTDKFTQQKYTRAMNRFSRGEAPNWRTDTIIGAQRIDNCSFSLQYSNNSLTIDIRKTLPKFVLDKVTGKNGLNWNPPPANEMLFWKITSVAADAKEYIKRYEQYRNTYCS